MTEYTKVNFPEIKEPKYFFYTENIARTLTKHGLLSFFTVSERPIITSIPKELRGENFVKATMHYEIVSQFDNYPIVHIPNKKESDLYDLQKSDPLDHYYAYGVTKIDATNLLLTKLSDDTTVPIFGMQDKFYIEDGMIANYKGPSMLTDVGKFFINYLLFVDPFNDKIPYQNKLISAGVSDKLVQELILNDKTNRQEYNKYINNAFWFGEDGSIAIQTLSERALGTDPAIAKRKKELLEQHKNDLSDPIVMAKIEDELIAMDKAYIKGDVSEPFFQAVGNKAYKEQRKKMYIMVGLMSDFSKDTSRVVTVTNNMDKGYQVEDIPAVANEIRRGSYERGKSTAAGGAESKFITRAFQDIRITKEDCGTKRGKTFVLEDRYKKLFIGRYLIDGTTLTTENIDNYVGKKITIRSPMYCECKDGVCYRCCDKIINDARLDNIGMQSLAIADVMVTVAMKSMHSSSINTYKIEDIKRFIVE
jgi:hypothetical protein